MDITRRGFLAGAAASIPLAAKRPANEPTASPPDPRAAKQPADLSYLSLADAASLIKARRLSPLELAHALLDRIDRLNGRIGAFVTITHDQAIDAARAAEREIARGRYRGPLHGIPFAVKDTHYTKGI